MVRGFCFRLRRKPDDKEGMLVVNNEGMMFTARQLKL